MATQSQVLREIQKTIQQQANNVINTFKRDITRLGFIPYADKKENNGNKRTFWGRHNDGPTVSVVFDTDHITFTINFDCEKMRAIRKTKTAIPPISYQSKQVNQVELKYTKMDCADFKNVSKKALTEIKKQVQNLSRYR